MAFFIDFAKILLATCRDVLPIIVLITCFQLLVLRQPIPHLRRLIIGGVYVVIGLALFLAGLETQVRRDGLYVRFFPFHIRYKKFTMQDLSEYYAREYRPILEYGGWGIRWGKSGEAYNISGKKGLQLVFKNGKKLLIGSKNPQELVKAINSQKQN